MGFPYFSSMLKRLPSIPVHEEVFPDQIVQRKDEEIYLNYIQAPAIAFPSMKYTPLLRLSSERYISVCNTSYGVI